MFRNLRTATRLALAVACALAALWLVGAVAWTTAEDLNARIEEIGASDLPAVQYVGIVQEGKTRVARAMNALLVRNVEGELRRAVHADADEGWRSIEDALRRFDALPGSAHYGAARERVTPVLAEWRRHIDALVTKVRERERLVASGTAAESPEVYAVDADIWVDYLAARQAFAPLQEALDALSAEVRREADRAAADAAAQSRRGETVILVAAGLATAALVLFGTLLARRIARTIASLQQEAQRVRAAIADGRLDVRADPARVDDEFRGVLDGFNEAVDAFAGPFAATAGCLERIAKGDLPPRLETPYRGDFDRLRDNLNTCLATLERLVHDAERLADAGVAGRLGDRADVSLHQGSFRRIVDGVNRTLDAVVAPVNEATGVLERLAARDLRARVAGEYRGDHARLKEALNATAEALHASVAQVSRAVEQVSSSATQIAASSQSVASGASEQAASLEETSATVVTFASNTKRSAADAQQADALARAARTSAAEGAGAVERMREAMGSIRDSTEATATIIRDVSEIAFQTNLLSLNAAVEAARAGEAGRGFAVVAEEVRALAQRAKSAAAKTEDLIRASLANAGEGEQISADVAAKLGDIVGGVTKVSALVGQIAAAANEQSTAIEQVNRAVEEMDRVTQQNAANAEESSSAAVDLASQSEELARLVGSFRLAEAAEPARHDEPARASAPRQAQRPARGANGFHAPFAKF